MRQVLQDLAFRRGEMGALSLRLLWGIGLALAIGIGTSLDAWALTVSPNGISFQAVQGGSNPPSQSIRVSKGNNKPTTWTATDSAGWLTVSPGTGSITSTAQVAMTVNTSGLAAGTYSATVTIIVMKGGSAVIPVTLTVAAATTTSPSTTPTTTTSNSSTTPTTTTPSSSSTPTTTPPTSTSTTVSLRWSPPTDSAGVAGYKVYMGTAPGVYGPPINVGNVTSYVLSNFAVGTYYFVVTDYFSSGVESVPSNEVSRSIY